jgi:hypothetical protein
MMSRRVRLVQVVLAVAAVTALATPSLVVGAPPSLKHRPRLVRTAIRRRN